MADPRPLEPLSHGAPQRRRKPGRWAAATAGVLVVAVGGWQAAATASSTGPNYRTAAVGRGNVDETLSSTGTITSVTSSSLSFALAGRVANVLVTPGQHVTAGQLLAQLAQDRSSVAADQAKLAADQASETGTATTSTSASTPSTGGGTAQPAASTSTLSVSPAPLTTSTGTLPIALAAYTSRPGSGSASAAPAGAGTLRSQITAPGGLPAGMRCPRSVTPSPRQHHPDRSPATVNPPDPPAVDPEMSRTEPRTVGTAPIPRRGSGSRSTGRVQPHAVDQPSATQARLPVLARQP